MKKKLVSLLLVGVLTAGLAAGCGTKEGEENPNNNDNNNTESSESNESNDNTESNDDEQITYSNKQIIIGDITETSGDITPYWTNNASDYSAFKMITGLGTVEVDRDGKWVYNEQVVKDVQETENEDGSKTWTYTINDGLKYSDGSAVTAKDYVFQLLFWYSNEVVTDLEASEATASNFQYYVGGDAYLNGESDTFEGVHLIDEMTFSVTVDAANLPYYYGKALVSVTPDPIHSWCPEDVDIVETENGAKFTDNFTAEHIGDTVEAYRYNPTVCSGPYMFTSYDANAYAYTLTKNPNFPGNYEGQTANIETVILKYVAEDTLLDQLKTGAVDMITAIGTGDTIEAGLDLVADGGFDYITYPRAGYGMISFKCNQGPTQFTAVRQAVMYLLDRNAFAQNFTAGHGVVVHGPYGLQQWMVNEHAEDIEALNAYNYSPENAVAVLEEDGWVLNEDGSDYSGEGIRYKKLDDGTLMPLIIEWFSTDNNSVSDMIVTTLQQNPDVAAAGMQINQTVGSFNDLIQYYYDNTTENPYQMFNLATGFGNPYDVAYSFEPGSASNITALVGDEGQEIYDLAVAMNRVEEGDDTAYGEAWMAFIQKWNELVPEVPLYSNEFHDFFSSKIHDWDEDGYNNDYSSAVLYANVE